MKLGELCEVMVKTKAWGFGFTELHSNKSYTVVKVLLTGM